MKVLKYNLCTIINHGTEEEPQIEEIMPTVTIGWSESNEEIAKREAYNGEYTIEDDGKEEIFPEPTQLDILEAKVAYLEIMTGLYEE